MSKIKDYGYIFILFLTIAGLIWGFSAQKTELEKNIKESQDKIRELEIKTQKLEEKLETIREILVELRIDMKYQKEIISEIKTMLKNKDGGKTK